MKKKFLLPALAMSLLVACSGDNSATAVDEPNLDSVSSAEGNGPESSVSVESSGSESESSTSVESSGSESESSSSVESSAEAVAPQAFRKEIENTYPNNEATEVDDYDNYDYFGAELSGKEQFTYGRFEARMKMVSVSGSVSSMFLYYDESWKRGKEPWNEIDIEVLGRNPGMWQSNLITRYPDENSKNPQITSEYKTGFGFNATEDYHLFAMIWTPEYISWEIDSVEIRRDVVGMAQGQVEYMTLRQSLRFNLWASKSAGWVGKFTGAELKDGPVAQEIDYVRVYSYDPETKTFTEAWTDNFEGTALDTKHWSKGDWEMEKVTLSKDNVVVEDGVCKLLLTRVAK